MDIQQIIAFGLVALASLYLLRNLYRSVVAVVQKTGGCSSGCGKCANARNTAPTKGVTQRISLSEVRPISRNPK